ncbi:1810034M08Rik protein, putative [Brugia malayi]|uniref:1810034M08Rik protein, putative n=2 Tax=Brugia TaxID=6278 RepID=A0A0H5S2X3_BRUMA|nr:1810034M08Rik protein, putative [Brugia malayi]CRZ22565.1 Bm6162 [Brugia malayi]VIO93488.1 1810034M08Rik protein, putative [Brugia malayi]
MVEVLKDKGKKRMKSGTSRLFELLPDPYDISQRRFFRVCLFTDVKNASELRQALVDGSIDAALIKPELVLEVFTLLAAANKAVHQAAHNRLSARTLHAELIYSLSPDRNILESLLTFGIAEESRNLLVGIFDDESGEKMVKVAKKIDGKPVPMTILPQLADYERIKKLYKVKESEYNEETISDAIITRIATKDCI